MAGWNESNVDYMAKAIHAVTDGTSITLKTRNKLVYDINVNCTSM
jgi:hypothetical protein